MRFSIQFSLDTHWMIGRALGPKLSDPNIILDEVNIFKYYNIYHFNVIYFNFAKLGWWHMLGSHSLGLLFNVCLQCIEHHWKISIYLQVLYTLCSFLYNFISIVRSKNSIVFCILANNTFIILLPSYNHSNVFQGWLLVVSTITIIIVITTTTLVIIVLMELHQHFYYPPKNPSPL